MLIAKVKELKTIFENEDMETLKTIEFKYRKRKTTKKQSAVETSADESNPSVDCENNEEKAKSDE